MQIINSAPLLEDWFSHEIVDRKEQHKEINQRVITPLLNGIQPSGAYYVTGNSGSGKTFLFRKLFLDNATKIKSKLPHFECIYINSAVLSTPSSAGILRAINIKLSSYLPIQLDTKEKISKIKAWKSGSIHMDILRKLVEQKKLNLIIIIDEIEKNFNYEGENLIHALAEIRNEFIGKNYGIFTIFITNSKALADHFKLKTTSRVPLFTNFSSYTGDDLYEILKVVGKYALDTLDHKILRHIAEEVAGIDSSARQAKRLLYNYIEKGDFETALIQLDKDSLRDDISKLTIQQRITLVAINEETKTISKLKIRNIPQRYKEPFLTTKRTYRKYCEICNRQSIPIKGYRTFLRMLDGLANNGIIEYYTKLSRGRGRGWIGKIELVHDTSTIDDVLKQTIPVSISGQKPLFIFGTEPGEVKIT